MLECAARLRSPKQLRRAMRAVTLAMSLKTFSVEPSFALQNPSPEVRLFCLAAFAAARSRPLVKAAIVGFDIDDYARIAPLRVFEKEPRLLAVLDHIAQRRARSKGPMAAGSRDQGQKESPNAPRLGFDGNATAAQMNTVTGTKA